MILPILCCFATIMYAWHRVSDWNQDDDSYDMWLNSLMQDSRDSPLNSSFMNICCKPREDNCASLFWKFSNSTRPNITLMKFDIHGLIASSRETSQSAIKTEPRKNLLFPNMIEGYKISV
ncbi:hypothetical protein F5879DRAFT_663373 [Lentinula edodes]|nr:hypothetical protein F5879DRAFT_663373 [Lentinula edodes]